MKYRDGDVLRATINGSGHDRNYLMFIIRDDEYLLAALYPAVRGRESTESMFFHPTTDEVESCLYTKVSHIEINDRSPYVPGKHLLEVFPELKEFYT